MKLAVSCALGTALLLSVGLAEETNPPATPPPVSNAPNQLRTLPTRTLQLPPGAEPSVSNRSRELPVRAAKLPPATPPPVLFLNTTNAATNQSFSLFDGQTLTGWRIASFGGGGEVEVKDGAIKVGMGADLTGITWTNAAVLPRENYEIELDVQKLDGNDFLCALTVPVLESHCSFIFGGWGGSVVGISNLDGMDASENDTYKTYYFERKRWIHLRIRVEAKHLSAWIDGTPVIDVDTTGRRISMRPGDIDQNIPLGLATYQTTALYRNLTLKKF